MKPSETVWADVGDAQAESPSTQPAPATDQPPDAAILQRQIETVRQHLRDTPIDSPEHNAATAEYQCLLNLKSHLNDSPNTPATQPTAVAGNDAQGQATQADVAAPVSASEITAKRNQERTALETQMNSQQQMLNLLPEDKRSESTLNGRIKIVREAESQLLTATDATIVADIISERKAAVAKVELERQKAEQAAQKAEQLAQQAAQEASSQSQSGVNPFAQPGQGQGYDTGSTSTNNSHPGYHRCPRCGGWGQIGHTDAGRFNKIIIGDPGPIRDCPDCGGTGWVPDNR